MQPREKPLQLDHELLMNLYGTQQHEARWTDFLDGLSAAVGVRTAAAQMIEWRGDEHDYTWTARDRYAQIHCELHDRVLNNAANPRRSAGVRQDAHRGIGSDQWHFRDDQAGFSRLREQLKKADLGTAIWADFLITPKHQFSIILHRDLGDDRSLSDEEDAFLRTLMPHLKQAVGTATQLAEAKRKAELDRAIFNQIRIGIVVCDSTQAVSWLNDAAMALLQRCPTVGIRNGRLQALTRQASQDLQRFFTPHDGNETNKVAAFALSNGRAMHMRARAVAECGGMAMAFDDQQTVLFMSEPAMSLETDPCELSHLMGLTQAEARLAGALANGTTLVDYAASRGIAEGTARIQLKQVFAKTDTCRQADLVRQLCGSILASPLTRV